MDDRALIGARVGGCDIRRILGRGAIGAVYEAVHPESGRRLAIKILSPLANDQPAVVDRFLREARLCYQLEHPSLIRVHTWGEHSDGRHYMVMDLIEGPTLGALIRARGPLPWAIAAAVMADVGEALAHAHAHDIVHRDIKPPNLLVSRGGYGILADLGLARQTVDALDEGSGRRLTTKGAALGSPAYMAPEQITNTAGVTAAADLYGLGASLYAAIAGQPPLTGESATATLIKVLREAAPRLDATGGGEVPEAIVELVDACLAKAPEQRPASAALFASCLRDELAATDFEDRDRATTVGDRG